MTNLVEFPGLGISIEVSRVAFTIGGIPIYWYGVLIGAGMLLAVLFAFRQAPKFGVSVDRMIDVIFIGFVLAIICGRAYYVLFVDFKYRDFFELIDLRSGGIAIYGGIIGAFIGALIGCKWRKVPVLPMFDLTGMGFLIGQCLGRWGNFTNQEAFGDNTDSIFGMISPATTRYLLNNQESLIEKGIVVDPYSPVHPTFLYESVWCALGFLLIFLYSKRRKFNGELFLMYIMWYGAGRFVIEGLRTDPLFIGDFRVSQLLALTSALGALVVWVIARIQTRGKPLVIPEIPPQTAKVKVDGPDGPTQVTISWPGDMRAPSKEQMRAMAAQVLQAEKEMDAAEEAGEAEQPSEVGEGDEADPVAKAELAGEEKSVEGEVSTDAEKTSAEEAPAEVEDSTEVDSTKGEKPAPKKPRKKPAPKPSKEEKSDEGDG